MSALPALTLKEKRMAKSNNVTLFRVELEDWIEQRYRDYELKYQDVVHELISLLSSYYGKSILEPHIKVGKNN